MKISLKKKPAMRGMEAVVLPIFKSKSVPMAFNGFPELDQLALRQKFKGSAGESVVYFSTDQNVLVIAVGAGKAYSESVAGTAKCAKTVISVLQKHKIKTALLRFLQDVPLSQKFWRNFIDFLYIGSYRFETYRQSEDTLQLKELGIWTLCKPSSEYLSSRLLQQRQLVNQSIRRTRDLVNEPASVANPDMLVKAFEQVVAESPDLSIQVLRNEQLQQQNLQGTLTVGNSSPYESAMVCIQYQPTNAVQSVALVGKGVTFDSGGLNIKTGPHMYDMKCDMSGAAAVLGLVSAIPTLEIPIAIHAFVPLAENLVGQHAFKPGDIITFKNRKTVEVVNTDSEGRLLLADALILAAETKPDFIVELSTLTGSVVSALGESLAGIMGNHKRLVSMLLKAGNNTGEWLWQLPLIEEYKESIKSKIANLKNAGYGRTAGAIKAGLFLEHFVSRRPFAHIDIAGTAFLSKANSVYLQEGATGFGVRLVLEFLELLALSEQKKK
jgi:leucyl aminopeptidase